MIFVGVGRLVIRSSDLVGRERTCGRAGVAPRIKLRRSS
ncbi:unnamed protein product [Linum tenue]|uniref:Uncharacterized protein n=1 Tax=Linum tenue TaxID=586396 RepID=A0AAV0GZI4_9ROSI|nr:unnamed protein product [Linum tenue]